MSNEAVTGQHQIYPAKYFGASQTWDHWCKLSIADVHRLSTEPVFESQHTYFYLNHPIRYVYIVAVVVGISDPSRLFTILTLDDGSGETIEAKITRESESTELGKTKVSNVKITSGFDGLAIRVDDVKVDIGSTLKVKSTIGVWRDKRQLDVKRVTVLKDTSEEVEAWSSMVLFKQQILSTPWALSQKDMQQVDDELCQVAEQERLEKKRATDKQERRAMHRQERERKHAENERRREYRRARLEREMNQGSLV